MEVTLRAIKDKLRRIQEKKNESELFPFLQQLFIKKTYNNVLITHGPNEYGKDLVFTEFDEKMQESRWFAAIVKNKNAEMQDFEGQGEIIRQVDLAFKYPFKNDKAEECTINTIIVIINGTVSNQAKEIMSKTLHPYMLSNVHIWSYQKLAEEIYNHSREEFLLEFSPKLSSFIIKQEKKIIKYSGSLELYHGLSVSDINEIYINVKTSLRKYQEKAKTYVDYEKNAQTIKQIEIDESLNILSSNKDVIIHGIATSGKSLLLKRIGYNSLRQAGEKPNYPFLIELGKITDFNILDLYELLQLDYIDSEGEELKIEDFNKIILLLDGLDEVNLDENKRRLIEQIIKFKNDFNHIEKHPALQLIITSRDINLIEDENLLPDFDKIELLPFDVGQAFKLVKKLIPGNKIKAERFINAIKEDQLSNSLTRTPMALTMMAILYRDNEVDLEELPANITELYNKFTDYYLNRWDISKGISLQYKYEETRQILGFIAIKMHESGSRSITYNNLLIFLSEIKEKYNYEDLKDINSFLEALKRRVGILNFYEDTQTFEFSHLTFQEYFASISFDDTSEDKLLDTFFDEWWNNILVFYCGHQPRRDVFIKKAINKLTPINIAQDFLFMNQLSRCTQASHLIESDVKVDVAKRIVFVFDQFYLKLKKIESTTGFGLMHNFSTIDFIIQFRDLLKKLLSSKHIQTDQFKDFSLELLKNEEVNLSDITLYSLAHFMSNHYRNPQYLEVFIERKDLNVRWFRIVYIDIELLHYSNKIEEKLWLRITQKQEKHKKYIKQQFAQLAYKHLK